MLGFVPHPNLHKLDIHFRINAMEGLLRSQCQPDKHGLRLKGLEFVVCLIPHMYFTCVSGFIAATGSRVAPTPDIGHATLVFFDPIGFSGFGNKILTD
jgi:hypothetical protein